jgi:hypothetical protein
LRLGVAADEAEELEGEVLLVEPAVLPAVLPVELVSPVVPLVDPVLLGGVDEVDEPEPYDELELELSSLPRISTLCPTWLVSWLSSLATSL